MATKKSQVEKVEEKFTVIKMICDNCGEDVYYVFACSHCGQYLSFDTATQMSKSEIKDLMEEEGKEFRGDIKAIVGNTDEFDTPAVGSLEVDEVDELYGDGFGDL